MVTAILNQLQGLALNFVSGAAPDWVQLIPAGPAVVGRDGRSWRMSDPARVVAAFDARKAPQIDIEHASQLKAPQGEPAPAVGWIEALEVRDGAIWGRVDWTAEGEAAVTSRAYRYLSPAFAFNGTTGEILRIVSAGLTNNPNLDMAALNAADPSPQESEGMDKAVLEALGLNADGTAAQAVVAITKLKDDRATALNAAQHPDPEKFVPKADHQMALNRIAGFEAEAKTRAETEITAAVDAAVAAGKVAPASKEYHLASCRAEGGLERFRAMVAASPEIAGGKAPQKKTEAGGALTPEELAVCRQMDMDPKEFRAFQAGTAKPE
ncbi:phage protease [Albidovulum sp.]|uniref:phage protease n=1 Tax=Albidovulum sp. TaxID=1872424 RepID=UPI0039B86B4D